ncbi:MAG: PSD1 domain-containing protein [Candidatus Hydrogenedentes bacterium]|nr:PSD1 domain-containing protein [Candidatus Hydrogenedentota bacterium]
MWRLRLEAFVLILAGLAHTGGVIAGEAPDFNREVLPILSNNCFACHGPDAPARKAGLRLDLEEAAKGAGKDGARPVAPGDPSASLILERMTAPDPDKRMPPPETGKSLSEAEIETVRRWIAAGAPWQAHWAFIPPARPAVPEVAPAEWPRNPVDNFVLARLADAGMTPSPEADRHTLIRRASLALTGVPPTPEAVEAFVLDADPHAYERLVDRLLASPRYGEHLGRYWLDLARYADTNGYAADIERTMWRYRDWVIAAFNQNMPFDQFTVEQLAGDLLPAPTLEQRIATGFSRNHPIMMEGGAIFEEYRVMNVVDRVDTTGAVWLGLTLKCAQCHDHKYDPISQREFYAMYAFFNNITEEESRLFGTELDGNSIPRIPAPLPEQSAARARLEAAIAAVREEKLRPDPALDAAQAAWEAEERAAAGARWTPVEVSRETPEAGVAVLTGILEQEGVTAVRLSAGGDAASLRIAEVELGVAPADGAGEAAPVALAGSAAIAGDAAPAHDGSLETAWEGEALVLAAGAPIGADGSSLLRVTVRGAAAQDGVRVEVSSDPGWLPAAMGPWHVTGPYVEATGDAALDTAHVAPGGIDLDALRPDGTPVWGRPEGEFADGKPQGLPGKTCATYLYRTISAPTPRTMDLALDNRNAVRLWVNGRLVLDKAAQRGEVGPHPAPVTIELRAGENAVLAKVVDYYDFNGHSFFFARRGEELGPMPLLVARALARGPEERSDAENVALRTFYRSRHWDSWAALHEEERDQAWALSRLDAQIPTTMVMEERSEPRPAHVLVRGLYDQPGEAVAPGVPAALHGWPEGTPANRLGFARWVVAPENPLAARVTVNRFWQRLFGEGLVRTPDDFGLQGDRPSHPELLDWLAVEFVTSGWDVRAMHRLLATSATFRQSSRVRGDGADPDNRLLARGPRFRLDAEVIRDSALAASGLLVERLGGPSVKPYQPPGLWRDVAYGGGGQRYTAQEFIQDHGEKLYRRSLYTFWKRAAAPPGMLIFDAPNRDVCTARRSRSNTPLQALVLMNDVQYVEAAREVARRVLEEAGPGAGERIEYACRVVFGRPPRPVEMAALLAQYETEAATYRARPDAAKALLGVGETVAGEGYDPAELAAWTLVASALMNADAFVTQY